MIFERLEAFPLTLKTLVVFGDFNTILDARLDSVGSFSRSCVSRLGCLLKRFSW